MRPITLVLPHFCNVGMLDEQQRVWRDYPPEVKAHLHVIVVDDCSPKSIEVGQTNGTRAIFGCRPSAKRVIETGIASLQIYRLTKKKRWNWLACRNLGARLATTEWLFLTDIDHVVPAETFVRIMAGALDPREVYQFSRVSATQPWPYVASALPQWKKHNDTWLLTKTLFWSDAVGGYDERLSGCYGTSGEFTGRLERAARGKTVLPELIVRYPREIIADASTPPELYTRKNDPINDDDLKERKAQRARIPDWKPLHGLIPWERVV